MKKDEGLQALLARQAQLDKEAEELQRQIREARAASASAVFEQVSALLTENAQFFSLAQRNHLNRLLDGEQRNARVRKPKGEPKYQLDTGEVAYARGQKPQAFKDWENSAAGKKWRKENPDQRFPPYRGVATK